MTPPNAPAAEPLPGAPLPPSGRAATPAVDEPIHDRGAGAPPDADRVDTLGRFDEIDDLECAELLRSHNVGRVGFLASEGVVMLPVAYQMVHDSLLVFGTRPGSVMAPLHHPGVVVALELDDLDLDTGTGWSVLVHGRTEEVDDAVLRGLTPWASGDRSLPVGIRIERRSGRVVSRPE